MIILIKNENFSSETADENAVSVSGDVDVTIENSTIEKKGDSDGGDNTSFYGTNSAVIAKNGANLTLKNLTVTTKASNLTVNNATLVAKKSEGLIVEGKNSITINNCDLEDSNTALNGQSTTYKNIFLYQSMSGDASEGKATFTANNSKQ